MIAVALAVIIGVIAVTCGVVADSNHADTLTFLGVMVKTTAAQIFLAGAICTWALFASLWLFSVGVRRSRERGIELRALKAPRSRGLPKAGIAAGDLAEAGFTSGDLAEAGIAAADLPKAGRTVGDLAEAGIAAGDLAEAGIAADPAKGRIAAELAAGQDAGPEADAEPTISLDELNSFVEPGMDREGETGRGRMHSADPFA